MPSGRVDEPDIEFTVDELVWGEWLRLLPAWHLHYIFNHRVKGESLECYWHDLFMRGAMMTGDMDEALAEHFGEQSRKVV